MKEKIERNSYCSKKLSTKFSQGSGLKVHKVVVNVFDSLHGIKFTGVDRLLQHGFSQNKPYTGFSKEQLENETVIGTHK